MKENVQIAVDFASKLRKIKGILQVVLFGSVAKGEDKADSDVDIAIVHNLKDVEELKSFVNRFVHERIQVVYINIDKLAKEPELVSALTGEGLILYGKPIKVILDKKELKPFILIVYDTTELEAKQRMLLNRALHGSVSVSRYKGKLYKTEKKGIVSEAGIFKITKACLLAEPKKAVVVRDALKRFGVKFREEIIWR